MARIYIPYLPPLPCFSPSLASMMRFSFLQKRDYGPRSIGLITLWLIYNLNCSVTPYNRHPPSNNLLPVTDNFLPAPTTTTSFTHDHPSCSVVFPYHFGPDRGTTPTPRSHGRETSYERSKRMYNWLRVTSFSLRAKPPSAPQGQAKVRARKLLVP